MWDECECVARAKDDFVKQIPVGPCDALAFIPSAEFFGNQLKIESKPMKSGKLYLYMYPSPISTTIDTLCDVM